MSLLIGFNPGAFSYTACKPAGTDSSADRQAFLSPGDVVAVGVSTFMGALVYTPT